MSGERRRNAAFLHQLMTEAGLTYQDTAGLLHVSWHTVRAWMKPPTSSSSANAPAMAVELLCLKLGRPVPPWLDDEDAADR